MGEMIMLILFFFQVELFTTAMTKVKKTAHTLKDVV